MRQTLSRRRLLAGTAGLTVASVVPSYVLGGPAGRVAARRGEVPPSEQLHVAVIGTGGQGITNIKALLTHPDVKIVAICDPEFWGQQQTYQAPRWAASLKAIEDHFRRLSGRAGVCVDYRVC
jgi:hypothetical protein